MEKKQLIKLTGTVETVVFSNRDTGFTVLELSHQDQLITAVGEIPEVGEGETLTLHGVYTTHPSFGSQFKVSAFERSLPSTAAAIQRYLASGAVKGIGPVLASRLVQAFGDQTLEVMEHNPERLSEVQGISPSKCQKLAEEFRRMFGIRLVMAFLATLGLDSTTSIAVWKKWGTNARRLLEENPFLLCAEDLDLDFEHCDRIAQSLGIPPDSSYRIEAALLFILRHNLHNGHTCLPTDKLLPSASALTGQNAIMVEKALDQLGQNRQITRLLVNSREYCYLPEFFQAEQDIAAKLQLMLLLPPQLTEDTEGWITQLEEHSGIQYAALQREAMRQALQNNLFLLTGGPGTGKTTTINAILELFDRARLKVALCAPTGRAAKRMSEVTGREAKTIHRLLEVDFGSTKSLTFKRNQRNPLPADVVIVDEVSMVDVPLMRSLVAALRMGSRLILVGDSDQLPSVGPGNVLKDLLDSQMVPTVRLTQIFRQAQQSMIVTNAHAIVRGELPNLSSRDNDFFFLRREDYAQMTATVVELVSLRLPKRYGYSPLQDIQVIAPTRVGPVGTNSLNQALQQVLNPPAPQKEEFRQGGKLLRTGDKVMQIKNNYDIVWSRPGGEEGMGVYNGDIGIIQQIDRSTKTILIQYDDRESTYLFEMADQLELAYAVTVHKSQGSEFPAVVLPLMHYRSKMHYRNLLYTAVTRAKSNLILLGREQTVAEMVANDKKTIRYTNLLEILLGEVQEP